MIPDSFSRAVVGEIGEQERDGGRSLERFLEKKGMVPIDFQNARIPLYSQWNHNHIKIGESHVYLVGDAASHVKVSTMGGVVTGFRGALGVDEAILNGGSRRELRALRQELSLHLLIRKVLNRFTQADYTRLLDMLNPSAESFLPISAQGRKVIISIYWADRDLMNRIRLR